MPGQHGEGPVLRGHRHPARRLGDDRRLAGDRVTDHGERVGRRDQQRVEGRRSAGRAASGRWPGRSRRRAGAATKRAPTSESLSLSNTVPAALQLAADRRVIGERAVVDEALVGPHHINRPSLPHGIDRLTLRRLAVGERTIDLTFQKAGERIAVYPQAPGAGPDPGADLRVRVGLTPGGGCGGIGGPGELNRPAGSQRSSSAWRVAKLKRSDCMRMMSRISATTTSPWVAASSSKLSRDRRPHGGVLLDLEAGATWRL